MPSWFLEDAELIAAENPYTFYKPSQDVIRKVAPGEIVKLIFRFESNDPGAPAAERMWVLVDEVAPTGSFKGRLDNIPRYIADIKIGDPVEFMACHIINTEHDNPDNLVDRYSKRCFVTNRILNDEMPVGYLYREEPDQEDDSGWRFTANDESDEYMENSENIAYVSIGTVLSKDDSFRELLDSPVGATFMRNPTTGHFEAAEEN